MAYTLLAVLQQQGLILLVVLLGQGSSNWLCFSARAQPSDCALTVRAIHVSCASKLSILVLCFFVNADAMGSAFISLTVLVMVVLNKPYWL